MGGSVHDTFAIAVKGYRVGTNGERAPGMAGLLGSAPWGPAPSLSIPQAPDPAAGAGGLVQARSWKYNGEKNNWFLLSQNVKFSEEDKAKQVTVKCDECPGEEVKGAIGDKAGTLQLKLEEKTWLRCGGFSKASVSFLQPL